MSLIFRNSLIWNIELASLTLFLLLFYFNKHLVHLEHSIFFLIEAFKTTACWIFNENIQESIS